VLTIGLGLSYGPQSALYAEMFPANVRYSGVSIGYAIGAIFGGAFAPLIAELLLSRFGSTTSIAVYVAVVGLISLVAVSLVKETKGNNLRVEEAHQDYLRTHPQADNK
ncbi:MHS family MFS transporter, partial [Arthrobacter deserti]|nr:MHS family MFS transporter [Arthrobacter deserti]